MTRVQVVANSGAGSAALTIAKPTAGNVGLLIVELSDALAKISTPAGWTAIGAGAASGTAESCLAFIRVFDGTESTTLTASTTSALKVRAEFFEYSGVSTTTPFDNTSGVGYLYTTGATSITMGPITPTAGSKTLVAGEGNASSATSAPAWSNGFTQQANTDTNRGVAADLAVTANGSTAYSTTYSWTASSNNGAAGFIIALNAAAAGGASVVGAATLALTLTTVAAARRKALAAATLPVSFTRTVTGRLGAVGSAALNLTLASTAAARRKALASATLALTLGTTATARRRAMGAATTALTFSSSVAGLVGRFAQAAATMALTFTATVGGRRKAVASSTTRVTLTTTASGRRRATAAAAMATTVGIAATGRRKAQAAATLALNVALTAAGTARGPIGYGFAVVSAAARWVASLTTRTDAAQVAARQAGTAAITAREI